MKRSSNMAKTSLKSVDALKLENQLCFPLYAASKELVRRYQPHLKKIGLTYTQYITMMVLWEEQTVTVKELGERLYLDSGTLSPLLRKLEAKKLIYKKRSPHDERNVVITITEQGNALKQKAAKIPSQIVKCLPLSEDESAILYKLLKKAINGFSSM